MINKSDIVNLYTSRFSNKELETGKYTVVGIVRSKSGYSVIEAIINRYIQFGKDIVFCCYEDVRKPGEWCHRLVFAEWWYEKTGVRIEELRDSSPIPRTKDKNQTEKR